MSDYEVSPQSGDKMSERLREDVEAALADHQHYWTAVAFWRVKPPFEGTVILDSENMRNGLSIGCYICHVTYHPDLLDQECPGPGDTDPLEGL